MNFHLPVCLFVSLNFISSLSCWAEDTAFSLEPETVALWNFNGSSKDVVRDDGPLRLDIPLPMAAGENFSWNPGKFGEALHFPGHLMLTAPKTKLLDLQKEISVEVWLKISKSGAGAQMGVLQNIDWPQAGFRLEIDPSGKVVWLVGASTKELAVVSQTQLSPDVWTYVAATYDGNAMNIFINGTLDTSQQESGGVPKPNTPNLYIGYFDQVNPVYFNGDINGIRISNVAKKSFPMPNNEP